MIGAITSGADCCGRKGAMGMSSMICIAGWLHNLLYLLDLFPFILGDFFILYGFGVLSYVACVLLLGATYYGTAVDLWSTGCILAELYAGKPIMPGRTEVGSGLRGSAMLVVLVVEQLHKIFKLCGSPSEDYWRKSKLPHATIFKPQQPYRRCVAETFKDFPTPALGLMETLLSIDPADRGSAASALKSEFFTVKPLPCDPSSLPKYPHSKEFDAKYEMKKLEATAKEINLDCNILLMHWNRLVLNYWSSGDIDLCFANEDETRELLRDDENASPEAALEFLAKHCQWAVVTLGSNRCLGNAEERCALWRISYILLLHFFPNSQRHIDVDMYITHLKLYAHLLHIAVGGCCTVDNCYRVLHCGHHLNGHRKFNYLNVLYLRELSVPAAIETSNYATSGESSQFERIAGSSPALFAELPHSLIPGPATSYLLGDHQQKDNQGVSRKSRFSDLNFISGSFSWASEANLFSAAGGMNKEACSQVESGTNPTAFPSIVSEENLEWEF
ncbi:putative serine/threonine-protein kinase [Vitis vinifera]|uniref:Putative serine/threonine-protein kinase n=1 Tax=Vitis vinifera TaxID=29760 RepID=A0A438HZR3_VITVI|nr:putative serine/threonine-protein kinase [Vitis vinifera]